MSSIEWTVRGLAARLFHESLSLTSSSPPRPHPLCSMSFLWPLVNLGSCSVVVHTRSSPLLLTPTPSVCFSCTCICIAGRLIFTCVACYIYMWTQNDISNEAPGKAWKSLPRLTNNLVVTIIAADATLRLSSRHSCGEVPPSLSLRSTPAFAF
jgi:hypothetical protein